MPTEKRKPRAYKIADAPYNKALKRGKKDIYPELSVLLERVAIHYGKGFSIFAEDKKGTRALLSVTVKLPNLKQSKK